MRFQNYIDQHKDDLVEKLAGCIQIPSVYADDNSGFPYGQALHDCLHYVLNLAQELGFAVHNMDEQLGWCEYGQGEEMVAVLGHLDVVPEGDGWSVPPYSGLVKDGRFYGRGTMDDKGPTIAALYALLALKESGLPINRRIRILFGLNEETGSLDMKYYADHGGEMPVMGFTPDGEYPVINGEKGLITEGYEAHYTPTGAVRIREIWGGTAFNIVPANAWADLICPEELAKEIAAQAAEGITCTQTADGLRIEAEGLSAHGSTPWEGVNAIGLLTKQLAKLPLEGEEKAVVTFLAEKIGTEWDGQSLGIAISDADSGALTFNLGTLRGGSGTMSLAVNYRYPVTKSFADCGPVVEKAMGDAGFARIACAHKEGIYMAPDSPLVQRLMKVYATCTGDVNAKPKCIGGGTYAKAIPNTLAFGPIFPGDEVREHKSDEFMEIRRLLDNANMLAEAMYALATD